MIQWDATLLPLHAGSIDALISDIPFGIRHGSHKTNIKLYPQILKEFWRVLANNGRCLLLTSERDYMNQLLEQPPSPWIIWKADNPAQKNWLHINMGGVDAYIFHMKKNPNCSQEELSQWFQLVNSIQENKRKKDRKKGQKSEKKQKANDQNVTDVNQT